jgi:DNA adenine methylase-like protein
LKLPDYGARVAAVIVATSMGQYAVGRTNTFKEAHLRHYHNRFEHYVTGTRAKLDRIRDELPITSYFPGDWLEHIEEAKRCGGGVIGYEKDWMARAVERDANFVKLPGPALGAVCSFWRSSKTSGLGHTGFYRGETKTNVLVEGGNESDAVRRQFSLKPNLVGYYWPKDYPLPQIGGIGVDDDGKPIGSVV